MKKLTKYCILQGVMGALLSPLTLAADNELRISRYSGGLLHAELPVERATDLVILPQPNDFIQSWHWSGSRLVHSNGYCLTGDILGAQNGGNVFLAPCNGHDSRQQWSQLGGPVDAQIINAEGKCLDVPGGQSELGVQLWECNGNLHQLWNLLPKQPVKTIKVTSVLGKAMAADSSIYNGSKVAIDEPCSVDNNNCNPALQTWHWDRTGSLLNGRGQCLAVKGDEQYKDGGKVFMWNCNNTDSQRWVRDGQQIKSLTGMCLDIPGGNTNNGTALQIWTCNGNLHQQWLVE